MTKTLGEAKVELRNRFLGKRNEIEVTKRQEKSKAICHLLDSLDCVTEAVNVLVYVNYRSEVQTKEYIEYLLKSTNKHIFAPRVLGMDIEFFEIDSLEDLEEGYQKILEPKISENIVKYAGADETKTVVLVPGTVFDKNGTRMGYGKGFYDRFLEKYPQLIKIGLSFAEQISKTDIPREEHDIIMNYVVTDERMYFI